MRHTRDQAKSWGRKMKSAEPCVVVLLCVFMSQKYLNIIQSLKKIEEVSSSAMLAAIHVKHAVHTGVHSRAEHPLKQ